MRLTVETGPLAGTVVTLDRSQPTVLGSAPDCAIRVQEPGVAPQHAVVKALKDSGFGVKALTNGLRLNGEAIEAAPLHDGDVLELGTTRIAFGELQKRGMPQIAGFRILEELGRGGMGVVYRAEQTSLHREVALKVLNRDLTRDPAFVAKFVAEARSAAKLQHPNVVQVFDVDHDGETYFITMELMHEGSLEDWLKQNGAMPVDRALRVVADAAAGLAYAESLGIVHRDIKPDNLMLDQHGAVKIADLGLASTLEENDGQSIGTPHFMAPEQVLRKDIDHRTDLYALGCTFYRLITGRTPFRGQTVKDILRAQVKEAPEPPQKVEPDVPAEVGNIVLHLMAKDPAERYQTANALLEDLDALLQPRAKKGLWIGLAAVAVLIAGGAIYWAVTRAPEYITVHEPKYDDPEKQQFADEIKVLKKAARDDRATIALLTARCMDLTGREFAAALDQVAEQHPGTPAAAEARERAEAARRDAAEHEQQTAQRQQRVDQHLGAQRQTLQPLLEAGDYARALAALAAAPPAELRDDPELTTGLTALREQVLTGARERLAALEAALAAAVTAKDDQALAAASEAAAAAVATAARWPTEVRPDLDRLAAATTAARDAAAAIAASRAASAWQQYHALFRGDDGLAAALRRLDFAAAAAAAAAFARTCTEPPVAAQAADLAAAADLAETFAVALAAAAAGGQTTLVLGDGATVTIDGWDRQSHQVTFTDPARKPQKQQIPGKDLRLDAWVTLADQVTGTALGARECFLGLLAVAEHAAAARDFLGQLRADDDTSGTGAAAYPLGSTLVEQLLRRLPDTDAEAWPRGLRGELQAAVHLASGLRALSERRNLAAGGHIDRLLAEHPHSGLVALLP